MSTKIQNPILTGFNPDPSMCFVDGKYYIATSTFEWFPGVQIHVSDDLVNWELACRPLDRISMLDMKGNPPSGGIWAPCLTHNKGKFYLIYTDVKGWSDLETPFKDCNNYLTTANDIKGPWSEPVYMNSSGFDASLFHDDDGKIWYINLDWDYRKEKTLKFSGIVAQEFDEKSGKLIGDVTKIYKGTKLGMTEGPHIFKKDEYYYLMVAEGGTSYEHAESIARSKNVLGPYVDHPSNPIITSRDKDVYLKKAGHASMCKNDKDQWYLVHLCGRPLEGTDRCVLGRETSIQKIEWMDGWPYISSKGGPCNTPQDYIEIDNDVEKSVVVKRRWTFDNWNFKMGFQSLRIPMEEFATIDERKGFLRLYGRESVVSRFTQALVATRQKDFAFEAETKVECNPQSFHHMAGLSYRYDERSLYYFRVSFDESDGKYYLGLLCFDKMNFNLVDIEIDFKGTIKLKVSVRNRKVKFLYSLDEEFIEFPGEYDASKLSDEYAMPMGFTGAFVGMQAVDTRHMDFYADFEYFEYKVLED